MWANRAVSSQNRFISNAFITSLNKMETVPWSRTTNRPALLKRTSAITDGPAANFLNAINAERLEASSKKLVAIGDGWTTTTSMPRDRTSGASEVANKVKNALVEAYIAESGLGTNPADDEVNPM